MKPKSILTMLIVLIILIGASLIIVNQQSNKRAKQSKLGGLLLENLPVNDINAITIKSKEDNVSLGKKEDKWVVLSTYDYPADFKKIIEIVKKFKDSKVGRKFNASKGTINRLGLKKPDDKDADDDQKGIRVILADKDNKIIADVIVGKTRDTETGATGGQYVLLTNENQIYLIDQTLKYTEKKSSGWIEKELVDVKAEDIAKVICTDYEQKTVYTIERPEKGKKPELKEQIPENKKLKSNELDTVLRALSSLRIEDVVNPEEKREDKSKLTKLEFHLFNGTCYTVYPEKVFKDDEDKFYFRIEASYNKPPEKETEISETKPVTDDKQADKPVEKTPEELAFEADQLNKKISSWTYVLSKWKFENFISKINEFFEDKEEKKEN